MEKPELPKKIMFTNESLLDYLKWLTERIHKLEQYDSFLDSKIDDVKSLIPSPEAGKQEPEKRKKCSGCGNWISFDTPECPKRPEAKEPELNHPMPEMNQIVGHLCEKEPEKRSHKEVWLKREAVIEEVKEWSNKFYGFIPNHMAELITRLEKL